jgi:hypothetical protein
VKISLAKTSELVSLVCSYGIRIVVVLFGGLGLINSLGTEWFSTLNFLYVAILAIYLAATRGRIFSSFRKRPLTALSFFGFTYVAVFVNQWAFVNVEAYLSVCVATLFLVAIPYLFKLAVTLNKYRVQTIA